MKRYIKQPIEGGVRPSGAEYVVDYTYNLPEDIIEIVPPQLYKNIYHNQVYWFGYKFKDNVSSKMRTKFINYIKGLGDTSMSENDLRQFIELPLGELNKKINLYNIDCLVYPISKRSTLVNKIVSSVNTFLLKGSLKFSFELVKSLPTNIEFDWETFYADNSDDANTCKQMEAYVQNVLMPAIHKLDYFSLAQNVKPKYRKYIKNYLQLSDRDAERVSKLKCNSILIVDDINTSGSTLNEILQVLGALNEDCQIFVYTLIGREDG